MGPTDDALQEEALAVDRGHEVVEAHVAQPGAPLVAVADLVVDEHVEPHVVERLVAERRRPPQVGVGHRHGELDAVLAGGEGVVALDHDDGALELGLDARSSVSVGLDGGGVSPVARATQVRRVTARGSSLSSTTRTASVARSTSAWGQRSRQWRTRTGPVVWRLTGRQMPPGLWPDPSRAERPKAPVRSRTRPGADGVVVDLHGEEVLVAVARAGR